MVKMNFAAQEMLEAHRELTQLPLALKNARELGGIELLMYTGFWCAALILVSAAARKLT